MFLIALLVGFYFIGAWVEGTWLSWSLIQFTVGFYALSIALWGMVIHALRGGWK